MKHTTSQNSRKPIVISDPRRMQEILRQAKKEGKTVGLVPTMGALHFGHLSLVIASKEDCDVTVVSIFVNPKQFGVNEDFQSYPRDLLADLELLEQIGIDYVFAPTAEELYPRGFDTTIHVGGITAIFEGATRPGHFAGVATVVLKLFEITGANVAFFGRKDYQQLAVIRKMVADLNLPIEIIGCPTVRERDGLAMSSRNRYLSPEERKKATILYEAMTQAEFRIHQGERRASAIREEMTAMIVTVPGTQIDYIAFVDEKSLRELENLAGNIVILLAVRLGKTRLIDNLLVEPPIAKMGCNQ